MSLSDTSKTLRKFQPNQIISYSTLIRSRKHIWFRAIIPCLIILMFCSPVGLNPSQSGLDYGGLSNETLQNLFRPAEGQQAYSSSGAAQQVTFDGSFTNDTQGLVMVDPSATKPVSIHAPSGWTGNGLSGSLEYMSTEFRPLRNGLLDDYHGERHILPGSPWNAEVFDVPDYWSLLKNGDSTSHPTHGGLYWYTAAGSGRDGSMGWRPSVLFS
ncbi:MAG: hypothetical protein ACFFE6_12740, partial [Candidatus Thorarchaeota archaeon]